MFSALNKMNTWEINILVILQFNFPQVLPRLCKYINYKKYETINVWWTQVQISLTPFTCSFANLASMDTLISGRREWIWLAYFTMKLETDWLYPHSGFWSHIWVSTSSFKHTFFHFFLITSQYTNEQLKLVWRSMQEKVNHRWPSTSFEK